MIALPGPPFDSIVCIAVSVHMFAYSYVLYLHYSTHYKLVLCDTRDTSILIVDTHVTIPVSPKSRYTAVYRSGKKIPWDGASIASIDDTTRLVPNGNEQNASVRCQKRT